MQDAKDDKKRIEEDERKRALEEMNRQGDKGVKVIVMPEYSMDKRLKVMREVNPPSEKLFIGLGYDDDHTTQRKHYRNYHPDELENNKEIFKQSVFCNAPILRGQERGAEAGFFSSLFSKT